MMFTSNPAKIFFNQWFNDRCILLYCMYNVLLFAFLCNMKYKVKGKHIACMYDIAVVLNYN